MNKIFFLIPFFIVGCSTPEIHIPSYDFNSNSDSIEDTNKHAEATSHVAHINVNEYQENSDTSTKTNTTNVIEIAEGHDTAEEKIEPPLPLPISEDILSDTKLPYLPAEKKKLETKNTSNINKKSSGFFSSLFKSKSKVKNQYYTGGKIRSKLVMSDNTGESGLLYKYGYEGQITSTIHIKNGIKNGLETLFNDKGKVMKRTPYVNGRKDGIVEVYYTDGKVLAQITYVDDKRHGRAAKYNHDGTTNEEVQYNNGHVITEQNDIDIPIID